MLITNATNLRKNLFSYLDLVVDFNNVMKVNTKKGSVVILSEKEYCGLIETLNLVSIPGMEKRLSEGLNAKAEDYAEFHW